MLTIQAALSDLLLLCKACAVFGVFAVCISEELADFEQILGINRIGVFVLSLVVLVITLEGKTHFSEGLTILCLDVVCEARN